MKYMTGVFILMAVFGIIIHQPGCVILSLLAAAGTVYAGKKFKEQDEAHALHSHSTPPRNAPTVPHGQELLQHHDCEASGSFTS